MCGMWLKTTHTGMVHKRKSLKVIGLMMIRKGPIQIVSYKNIITLCINFLEFQIIRLLKKKDASQVAHESASEVKRARLNNLMITNSFMKSNGSKRDMQKHFTHIINHLASSRKNLTNEKIIYKVLRCHLW